MNDAYNYAENNWGSREHSTGGGVVVLMRMTARCWYSRYPTFDPGIFDPDTPDLQRRRVPDRL
ncbi:MAG: hypothetical protein U0452_03735 [Anaerolineae bacterium]